MDASIIVCTYNRAESLKDTLAALAKLDVLPTREWEVVIVDNNSRDHTRQVVEEMQRTWPRLRYVFEPEQGLSHARNRGIAESNGEITLFTDDDVLPEPDWLETTLAGMTEYGADACGGYIAPIWETPPPAWLTERFYGFLAVRTDRTDDYPTASGYKPLRRGDGKLQCERDRAGHSDLPMADQRGEHQQQQSLRRLHECDVVGDQRQQWGRGELSLRGDRRQWEREFQRRGADAQDGYRHHPTTDRPERLPLFERDV